MDKNIYFKILKIFTNLSNITVIIKNIYTQNINFLVDNSNIKLEVDNKIKLKIINDEINFEIDGKIKKYPFHINNYDIRGFHENCIIETPTGQKEMKELESGDFVLDKNGSPLLIENIYVFIIDNSITNKPILIEKSKCGLNLPYSEVIMSMKSNLKIKKVTLRGRSLYLNGKAKLVEFDNYFNYYAIETKDKKDYLISGFVTDSL